MPLEIKIISPCTHAYSEHFLFIMIFVKLWSFAVGMSHDVHLGMREGSRFAFHLKNWLLFSTKQGISMSKPLILIIGNLFSINVRSLLSKD